MPLIQPWMITSPSIAIVPSITIGFDCVPERITLPVVTEASEVRLPTAGDQALSPANPPEGRGVAVSGPCAMTIDASG